MRVFVTGGAGFVGASLCAAIREAVPGATITAFDNLRRRGSELNLPRLSKLGVKFVHGDVRCGDDFAALGGNFDVLIEASAEPSVHAGTDGGIPYVFDVNTTGALHCLEFARQRCGMVIFLSTSRVYSIPALRDLPLQRGGHRLELSNGTTLPSGVSEQGIGESFTTGGFRSYYGSSKLASELICQEYAALARLPVIINRCGVIAGPGQFGKTDQGVFSLWVARHLFGGRLSYNGFGGEGLQVRDLLHPRDLGDLLMRQIASPAQRSGQVFNVGGGPTGAVSLREYSALCARATGVELAFGSVPETAEVDIPWYVTDNTKVHQTWGWLPKETPDAIVASIAAWMRANEPQLRPLFT